MTPENIRYHAAGHLAAAALLAQEHPNAAAVILRDVGRLADHPRVQAPPQVKEKLAKAAGDPRAHVQDITQLECWFVDPFNTLIEQSGQ